MSALMFIGGILTALFGALILVLGDLVGATFGDPSAVSFYVLGVVLAGLGIFNLFVAYGLWEGSGWAWIIALVFAIIGLASTLIESLAILASGGSASFLLAALPNVIVLSYLRRGHVRAFFGRGLPYNPEVVRNYTRKVMEHLASYPAESARVVAAFDESGQSGVVDYLKQEDRELTIEEARAVAFAITSNMERQLPTAREEEMKVLPPIDLPVQTTSDTGGSAETSPDQESKKEKSWIEKWLQR